MEKEANGKSQAIYGEDTANQETSLTAKRLLTAGFGFSGRNHVSVGRIRIRISCSSRITNAALLLVILCIGTQKLDLP